MRRHGPSKPHARATLRPKLLLLAAAVALSALFTYRGTPVILPGYVLAAKIFPLGLHSDFFWDFLFTLTLANAVLYWLILLLGWRLAMTLRGKR